MTDDPLMTALELQNFDPSTPEASDPEAEADIVGQIQAWGSEAAALSARSLERNGPVRPAQPEPEPELLTREELRRRRQEEERRGKRPHVSGPTPPSLARARRQRQMQSAASQPSLPPEPRTEAAPTAPVDVAAEREAKRQKLLRELQALDSPEDEGSEQASTSDAWTGLDVDEQEELSVADELREKIEHFLATGSTTHTKRFRDLIGSMARGLSLNSLPSHIKERVYGNMHEMLKQRPNRLAEGISYLYAESTEYNPRSVAHHIRGQLVVFLAGLLSMVTVGWQLAREAKEAKGGADD